MQDRISSTLPDSFLCLEKPCYKETEDMLDTACLEEEKAAYYAVGFWAKHVPYSSLVFLTRVLKGPFLSTRGAGVNA